MQRMEFHRIHFLAIAVAGSLLASTAGAAVPGATVAPAADAGLVMLAQAAAPKGPAAAMPKAAAPAAVSNSLVQAAQRELTYQRYKPGKIDGVMGPATGAAISAFQKAHKMPVTGRLDDATVKALGLR